MLLFLDSLCLCFFQTWIPSFFVVSLHHHSPGQEEGNIPFVEEGGFGKYSSDPQIVASTVQSWIANPTLLAQMQQNALTAARPQATLDIARDIAKILFDSIEAKNGSSSTTDRTTTSSSSSSSSSSLML